MGGLLERPVIKAKPDTTGRAKPVEMSTAVVETRFTPVQSLLTHVSGGRKVVRYWQSLLGSDDHVKPLDLNLEPAQQSYKLIENMELRQQGDMSQTPDDKTKEFTITGELTTYPGWTPNAGDMMQIDIGQGEYGIAHVTLATPMTIFKQTCYRIQFTVLWRNSQVHLDNLMKKTDVRCYFVMDFLRSGKNPIIVDEDHFQYQSLDRLHNAMIADYLRSFYSRVNETLVVPGQPGGCYDPFLLKALLSLLNVVDHPLVGRLSLHSVDIQYAYNTTTVWDAMLAVEPSLLYLACHQVGMVDKKVVKDRNIFGGFYWTRIQQIMFPMDDRIDADVQFSKLVSVKPELQQEAGPAVTDINRLMVNNEDSTNMEFVDDIPEVPRQIPEVNHDFFYVFTEAFYRNDVSKMSELEKMVLSILNQEQVDVSKLYAMVDMSRRWDKLERFYYVPVLIWMCVIAFRGPAHG